MSKELKLKEPITYQHKGERYIGPNVFEISSEDVETFLEDVAWEPLAGEDEDTEIDFDELDDEIDQVSDEVSEFVGQNVSPILEGLRSGDWDDKIDEVLTAEKQGSDRSSVKSEAKRRK